MKELPVEFENRMKTLLGDEFEDFKKSFNEPPVRAFRVNTDKISLEDFEKINKELEQYSPRLMRKPQIVAANKRDLVYDNEVYDGFCEEMEKRGLYEKYLEAPNK